MSTETKPLDARRAELRALGLTDAEVSQAIVAEVTGRATEPRQQTMTAGPGVGGQGVMSAVVSSFVAVMAYARGALPSIKSDCLILVGGSAPAAARAKAGASLVVKAAVVLLIAYAVRAEWQQHIISATETAANNAATSGAEREAATAKFKNPIDAAAPPVSRSAATLAGEECLRRFEAKSAARGWTDPSPHTPEAEADCLKREARRNPPL